MARRDQDRGQQMYKDAPASEADWDKGSRAALGGFREPQAGHYRFARSAARDAALGRNVRSKLPKPTALRSPRRRPSARPNPPRRRPNPASSLLQKRKSPPEKPRKSFLRRHPLMAGAGLIALLAAGAATYVYWDNASHFESTDDAFIAARQFAIAPKVAGYVTAVPVTDNQHVNKGDVIAQIDQRDYLTALAQAQAQVAGAEAGIHNIDTQIATQDAQIAANQAQVAQAQANMELARVTWGRDQPLVKQGWATAQQGTTDVQNSQGPAVRRR